MYFDGIKVGDKVWHCGFGDCKVDHTKEDSFTVAHRGVTIDKEGIILGEIEQSFFWSKPEFVPPPRPKKKVEKVIEGWTAPAWPERKDQYYFVINSSSLDRDYLISQGYVPAKLIVETEE
ncbi:MAG: hypothetical protein WC648_05340 [Candidatus Paceibacterota bacterium]|jgi:hypothetical protein